MVDSSPFKSVQSSQVILKELMVPSYANFGGKVHGGVLLSLMDKIAYTCAATHAKAYCVTASVDSVDFVNPVEVGELVTLFASVNYVGKSSMEVGIKVISEDFKKDVVKHTNTSYFTMVAVDEETKKPVPVPGLLLETDQELRRFVMGKLRKQLRTAHRKEITQLRKTLDKTRELQEIEGENCRLQEAT
ncbi:Acyl-CoA hydrolase [Marinospirillum celere]|uniref:Acyl-CoA hydrolase n=1 Tax=Marinospirillum celere TaxID=1122252 RepID=A0A1I1IAA8_9GAMM|nr:acyl-CoA thioesterase [Marinospirillum celere]SFC33279.1 Acyl-CoA hydrolase [Marinospirillum celere]